jgi:hypothetical protein
VTSIKNNLKYFVFVIIFNVYVETFAIQNNPIDIAIRYDEKKQNYEIINLKMNHFLVNSTSTSDTSCLSYKAKRFMSRDKVASNLLYHEADTVVSVSFDNLFQNSISENYFKKLIRSILNSISVLNNDRIPAVEVKIRGLRIELNRDPEISNWNDIQGSEVDYLSEMNNFLNSKDSLNDATRSLNQSGFFSLKINTPIGSGLFLVET